MSELKKLADRYIAVWNEPDANRRSSSIAELWTEDGAHFTKVHNARGYEALEARVAGAYEKWVQLGSFVFKSANNPEGHHNGVRFNWHMVRTDTGQVASVGFDFLVLDEDGRIRVDYQFLDTAPPQS